MGLFDKIKFWKKEDTSFSDLGLGNDNLGSDPFASDKDPFGDSKSLGDFGSTNPASADFGAPSSLSVKPEFQNAPPLQQSSSLQSRQSFNPQMQSSSQAQMPIQSQSFGNYNQAPSANFNSSPPRQFNQGMDQPDLNRPFTMSGASSPSFQQQPSFNSGSNYPNQPSFNSQSNLADSRDMEILSSKMETLRASLDIINQRLTNIERMMERDQMRRKTGW